MGSEWIVIRINSVYEEQFGLKCTRYAFKESLGWKGKSRSTATLIAEIMHVEVLNLMERVQ